MSKNVLSVENVTMQFGGVVAVDNLNLEVNEGEIAQSTEQENYRKLRRAYLVSYDRAIPSVRQANHCIGCKQCIEHCPQSISIPRELRRIEAYVEKLKRNTL